MHLSHSRRKSLHLNSTMGWELRKSLHSNSTSGWEFAEMSIAFDSWNRNIFGTRSLPKHDRNHFLQTSAWIQPSKSPPTICKCLQSFPNLLDLPKFDLVSSTREIGEPSERAAGERDGRPWAPPWGPSARARRDSGPRPTLRRAAQKVRRGSTVELNDSN